MLLLLLSHFSRVWLCAVPWMAAHQAPSSLGFSRQEQWSGLPFPSTMHESEKWKWSRSVVSDSSRPHGLQPTRLLHSWDFPGKSTGVGCHCLLRNCHEFFVSYEVPYTGTSYMPSHHWHHLSYVTWVIAFQKLLIVTCEWITHWRIVVFVVARSLRCFWFFATRELQHARLLCPLPSPGVCSNSWPLSLGCYLTISSLPPLLLLPSVFPSTRVFSKESVLHIRWPKCWSFSFSISPPNEYSRLISFRIDWFDLFTVQGLSSVFSSTIWKHQSFSSQPSLWSISYIHVCLLEKNIVLPIGTLLAKWRLCFLIC